MPKMILKTIQCVREISLEIKINATMVVMIKRSKKKKLHIIQSYMQWMGVSPSCIFHFKTNLDNKEWIECLKALVKGFAKEK